MFNFWRKPKKTPENPSIYLELLPNNQLFIKCNLPKCFSDQEMLTESRRYSELIFVMTNPWVLPKVKSAIGAAGFEGNCERLASEIILQFEQLQGEMAAKQQEQIAVNYKPGPQDEVVPPGRMFSHGGNA